MRTLYRVVNGELKTFKQVEHSAFHIKVSDEDGNIQESHIIHFQPSPKEAWMHFAAHCENELFIAKSDLDRARNNYEKIKRLLAKTRKRITNPTGA